MMFWFDHDPNGWGWVVMSISMMVFWALIIVGIVLVARGFQRQERDGSSSRPHAQQVLAERFARGEIDEEEYRQRLGVLSGESAARRRG